MEHGSIACTCSSNNYHTEHPYKLTYVNDIDCMAFYFPTFDCSCLVPIEDIGDRTSISFRNTPAKQNQKKKNAHVQDYTFDKIIKSAPYKDV